VTAVVFLAAAAAALELWRDSFRLAAFALLALGAAPALLHLRRPRTPELGLVLHQARLYRTLAAAVHGMVRAGSPEEVYAALCRAAVREGGFLLARVGAPDVAGRVRAVHLESAREEAEAYVGGAGIGVNADDPAGRGPTGTAWREERTVVVDDFSRDPRALLWREGALAAGLRSAAAVPLRPRAESRMVLTLYAGEAGFFAPEVVDLVESMVREAEHALESLALRREAAESGRALEESRRLLSKVLDTLPTACYVRDLDEQRVVFASPGVESLAGIAPDRLVEMGREIAGLLHPEDAELVLAAEQERRLRDGEVLQRQLRLRRPDGSWRWVRVRETVFERRADGRVRRVLGSAEDVTDLLALADENRGVARAVESAAESVVITGADGVIEYVNPAFCRLTGYAREEAVGRKPNMLKSGQVSESTYRDLWRTLMDGRVWQGRLVNRRKDGSLFEEEASISPVHDEEGRIAHFVAVKRDVTREQSLERELLQAQKLEAIGKLAGGVAHDFNNILTSILGCAELLSDAIPRDSALRGEVDEIARSGRRAADLTRQLLIFSRRQLVAPRILEPAAVVAELQKMLKRIVAEDYRLVFSLRADGTRIEADPGHLEQVVMNFVVNARDAMPRGGVLEVSAAGVELSAPLSGVDGPVPPGRYALLSVRDEGEGIPAEVLPRIFEPFFTTKPAGVGTGLGLSTVYGIVKQAGAHLRVESEAGRGTTMSVYWPARDAALPDASEASADAAPGRGESVLVVEDEAPVRALVERVLSSAGYRVSVSARADDGLRLGAGGEFALLLSDLVLPGEMNGRELGEALLRERPGLKVLYMSGYTGDVITRQGRLSPGARFLQKPFTRDALLRAVRTALDA
jgi:PAS domain S-box-containing protein